jgi:hypothetical protein
MQRLGHFAHIKGKGSIFSDGLPIIDNYTNAGEQLEKLNHT